MIDGNHTRDLGLKLLSYYIPLPPVNENIITIPGMSGGIDATEVATGYPTYGMRTGAKFIFKLYGDWFDFEVVKSQLAEWLHGKKVKVVMDNDPSYYYICRLELDAKKTTRINSTITISGSMDPMKYEITSSDEDWLWDSFNFETGVIRELSDIEITEDNTKVLVAAGSYPVSPIFKVVESNSLTVTYEGNTYSLPVGEMKIPRIKIGNKEVTLIFNGKGKLSISYRGERL